MGFSERLPIGMVLIESKLTEWEIDVVVVSLGYTGPEFEFYDGSGPTASQINASPRLWVVAAGNNARQHFSIDTLSAGSANISLDTGSTWTPSNDTANLDLTWDQWWSPCPHPSVAEMSTYNLIVKDKAGTTIGEPNTNTKVCAAGDKPKRNQPAGISGDIALRPYNVQIQKKPGAPGGTARVKLFTKRQGEFSPNSPFESMTYPAIVTNVVAVTALSNADYGPSAPVMDPVYSRGPRTDGMEKPELSAPDTVFSMVPGINNSRGTSFAAPRVGAAAALLKQLNPSLSDAQIRAHLTDQNTANGLATDIGPSSENAVSGWDKQWGFGKLVLKAMPYAPVTADGDGDGVFDNADSCPDRPNPGQLGQYGDMDMDLVPDACDPSCTGAPNIVVSQTTPTSGAVDDGLSVLGSGFVLDDQVVIAGVPAVTTLVSDTLLAAFVPPVSVGTHPVWVVRNGCVSGETVSFEVTASSGGGCGIGFEVIIVLLPIAGFRSRRRRRV